MKVIVAGSRSGIPEAAVHAAINNAVESGLIVDEIVSGKAKGVDAAGESWARANNVPIKEFPADWDTHGKVAGPIRNGEMAAYADALILVWDGQSRGSASMLKQAAAMGLKIYENIIETIG